MKMLFKTRMKTALALVAVAAGLLVACGPEQVAGIQGSGSPVAGAAAQGPITGFGSVFIDGVEYATSGAQIRVDGEAATESQLRVGHVVTIRGNVNPDGKTGTATELTFAQHLRGAIAQLDVSGGTFTVLGQTVRVTDETLFDENIDPSEIGGLQAGASVQVSGFTNATGELLASRVEPASATATLQVRGEVQTLDTAARTFRINALTVDYSAATVTGTLANASLVTVQGASLSTSGALVASRVEVSRGLAGAANDRGQLEGIIATFTSGSDFIVEGQRVITDANTELVLRGMSLGLNVPVKVRGTFNASGVLVASRVEVKPRSSSWARGLVDSVSAANNTLAVLGITVTVDDTTSFFDKSDQRVRSLRLEDLRTGDYVEVRGTPGASVSSLSATLVERDRPENRSYLRGVALNVAAPNLSVLGVTVATDAQTQFIGTGGQASAAAVFFAEAPNKLVKARGTLNGGVFLADRVQIEN